MKWNLRMVAAQRDIWRPTQLLAAFEQVGFTPSLSKVAALWSAKPITVRLDDLDRICAALVSGRLHLMVPDASHGAHVSQVDVRPLAEDDVARLGDQWSAAWSGQRAGRWTVLAAWLGSSLVGSGMLRWEGPFIPDIATRLPGQVEVGFLQVSTDLRGQGIGTRLMKLAERLARERGTGSLGLAVGDDNPRAQGFYVRLGYRPNGFRYTARYEAVDDAGQTRSITESGIYMIKSLTYPTSR